MCCIVYVACHRGNVGCNEQTTTNTWRNGALQTRQFHKQLSAAYRQSWSHGLCGITSTDSAARKEDTPPASPETSVAGPYAPPLCPPPTCRHTPTHLAHCGHSPTNLAYCRNSPTNLAHCGNSPTILAHSGYSFATSCSCSLAMHSFTLLCQPVPEPWRNPTHLFARVDMLLEWGLNSKPCARYGVADSRGLTLAQPCCCLLVLYAALKCSSKVGQRILDINDGVNSCAPSYQCNKC